MIKKINDRDKKENIIDTTKNYANQIKYIIGFE